jgi:hypothetical protein
MGDPIVMYTLDGTWIAWSTSTIVCQFANRLFLKFFFAGERSINVQGYKDKDISFRGENMNELWTIDQFNEDKRIDTLMCGIQEEMHDFDDKELEIIRKFKKKKFKKHAISIKNEFISLHLEVHP